MQFAALETIREATAFTLEVNRYFLLTIIALPTFQFECNLSASLVRRGFFGQLLVAGFLIAILRKGLGFGCKFLEVGIQAAIALDLTHSLKWGL